MARLELLDTDQIPAVESSEPARPVCAQIPAAGRRRSERARNVPAAGGKRPSCNDRARSAAGRLGLCGGCLQSTATMGLWTTELSERASEPRADGATWTAPWQYGQSSWKF